MTVPNLVKRLRAVAGMDLRTGGFLAHTLDTAAMAADEIERLREKLEAEIKINHAMRAALVDMIDLAQLITPYALGPSSKQRIEDAKGASYMTPEEITHEQSASGEVK